MKPAHRIGIIDLGSNSARLIVVEYTPGWCFRIVDEVSQRVRLSDGMYKDGMLQPDAMRRALETIRVFRSLCDASGAREIIPIATAAVRDSKNQQAFLMRLEEVSRLKFRVLSGNEEANFSTLGAINGIGLNNGFVMDVGGGSTEISAVRNGHVSQSGTTPLGALRLTEIFLPKRIDSHAGVFALRQHIRGILQTLSWLQAPSEEPAAVCGLGGTVRALVRIDREDQSYPLDLMNGYELPLRRIEKMILRIADLPMSERARKIRGLQEDRADIILAGAVTVAAILRHVSANRIIVSGQGVREGIFYSHFLLSNTGGVIPHLREFSVLNLARIYGRHPTHSEQVSRLALALFDQSSERHQLGALEREYLWAAAQLHDVGTVIDYYDHPEHSAYIVLHSGLPGFTHRETALIAQLCLYHRKGRPGLKPYSDLFHPGDLIRLKQLTAILRLAEYLDRGRTQAVTSLDLNFSNRREAVLRVRSRADAPAAIEIWEAKRNRELFNESFGCELQIL